MHPCLTLTVVELNAIAFLPTRACGGKVAQAWRRQLVMCRPPGVASRER